MRRREIAVKRNRTVTNRVRRERIGYHRHGCIYEQGMRNLRGFTYIGLLVAVALLSIGLAAVGQVWSTIAKRERERELLFIGSEFRRAIGRYYEGSPGAKHFPRKLEELVEDQRFPVVKRHLRKIYLDPMTGKANWALVVQGDQIVGVHSRSTAEPLKIDNFASADNSFAGSGSYADWQFVYAPLEAPGTPGVQNPGTAPQPGGTPQQPAGSPQQPGAMPQQPAGMMQMPQQGQQR